MLQEFIEQNYLIIEQNVVVNITLWNGDTTQWTPPQGSVALPQSTTPAKVWELNSDKTDFVLTEKNGAGGIGFTWDGSVLITNQPKPEIPQPPTDQPIATGTVAA